MNILIATDSNIEKSGVCMFILQWVREIKRNYPDFEVVVYFRKTTIDKDIEEEYKSIGVNIIKGELPQNGTSVSLKNRAKVKKDISSILKEKKFDVIHVNSSAAGFTSIVLFAGKKFNVPIRISHSHGRNLGNGMKNIYLWFVKKYNVCLATSYAGCSKDAGEYLFGKKIVRSAKWNFIPNTVDTKKFAFNSLVRKEYREKLHLSEEEVLIGATGALTERKNHIFLLDLVSKLKKQNKKIKLLILGEGDRRSCLEDYISANNLGDDVFLPGSSNEIPQWLSAMDVYAMPSLTEGLPIGAVEAQANGLYCILSDKIPNDVDLSDDIIHLPIDGEFDLWINEIKKYKIKNETERLKGCDIINKKGFGLSDTKKYIKLLYNI